MRWRRPSNASSMPRWVRPSRSRRSASPRPRSSSTLGCSSTPARTRCSTYSRSRCSSTTQSMPPGPPAGAASTRPAGPAPTMATSVSWAGHGAMMAARSAQAGQRPPAALGLAGPGADDRHDERRRRDDPRDEQDQQDRGEQRRQPAARRPLDRAQQDRRRRAVERGVPDLRARSRRGRSTPPTSPGSWARSVTVIDVGRRGPGRGELGGDTARRRRRRRRSASANASNPPVSVSWPDSVSVVVSPSLGRHPLEAHRR